MKIRGRRPSRDRGAFLRRTGRLSISRLLVQSAWVIAAASALLFGGAAVLILSASLAGQAQGIREEREASARALVKRETEKAVAFIERNQEDTLARLRQMLGERVGEAVSIAENIVRENRGTRSDAEIARMITDALRPIRFNGGRGYFFATRLDGTEMLFADRPDMEGRNLLGMTDTRGKFVIRDMIELVRADGQGFYSYMWTKPGVEGRDFPKLAFVKLFKPLGWFIGTGEYLDDFERETKQKVTSWLGNVSFGTDGYLFAGQWDGVSLIGPAVGRNMIDTTDVHGVKVVRELIQAARAGGGFVQYVMPSLEGKRPLLKLSYVLPIPEWEWYVGAGQYLADVDAEIRARQASLLAVGLRQAGWLIGVLLLLLGGMVAAATAGSRRLAKEFMVFDTFFREVSLARSVPPSLDSERLQFSELRRLSLTVNRMLAERATVEADRARLAAAVEQAAEAVIITDTSFVVQYVNPAYARISGYSRAEVVGRRPQYLDREDPEEKLPREQIGAACAAGQGWFGRIRLHRADGSVVELELDISPMRGAGGQVTNFTMVARDISERLKLEAQIAQTNKMEALGRLAGGVAHDFNNLLQVIHGYSELTQTELPPDHASLNNLAQISTATGRAADLVRQLLTFSRREAFKPLALDVNDLLADLMKMIARLIGEQVDVIVRPGDSLPAVSADPAQLRQVLINLCVNARDAMPDGGRLLVTTSAVELDERFCAEHRLPRAGTYVQIEVSDNGTGIPPAVRERIFEPFFTTKEVGKGTGLGLATVYGIMRQHDGLVLLDSEVGSGTTVRVFFPGAELPLDAVEQTAGAPAAPGLSRTVLLAEDERQVRDLTIQVLQRAGYRVIATSDGQEALKAFEQHAGIIDLALLDFVMPKMGGNKVRERLRSLRADLPILFATGYGSDLLLRGFVPSSRERLLSKPWTAQQLLKAIHELLEESQPPRAP